MPNIAKHESVIQALKDGTHHVLGLKINGLQVSPGTKVDKKGTYLYNYKTTIPTFYI